MLGRIAITNKIVAANLAKEEKEVESVMKFFFQELREEFAKCEYPYLYVKDLGTFGINRNLINKRLRTLVHKLKWHTENGAIFKDQERHKKNLGHIRDEIHSLFRIRRLVKERNKINNQIRRNGKALNDSERELVQTPGEE